MKYFIALGLCLLTFSSAFAFQRIDERFLDVKVEDLQVKGTHLPLFIVQTKDPNLEQIVKGVELEETNSRGYHILDKIDTMATLKVVYNRDGRNNRPYDMFNTIVTADGKSVSLPAFMTDIEIRVRGDFTSRQKKKQYAVGLVKENGKKNKVHLLGLGKSSKWVFNGPFLDASFARNALTFDLYRQMGHYASRTKYFELIINGQYQGVYVLLEKIDNKIEDVDGSYAFKVSKKDGFILRHDKAYQKQIRDEEFFVTPYSNEAAVEKGSAFLYVEPEPFKEKDLLKRKEVENRILNEIASFEKMLRSENFKNQYSQRIDAKTFYDFMIIQELTKNLDGFRKSLYFHTTDEAKIAMGPIWDFNMGYNNTIFAAGDILRKNYAGWEHQRGAIPFHSTLPLFWFERLMQDKAFREGLGKRYWELRKGPLNLYAVEKKVFCESDDKWHGYKDEIIGYTGYISDKLDSFYKEVIGPELSSLKVEDELVSVVTDNGYEPLKVQADPYEWLVSRTDYPLQTVRELRQKAVQSSPMAREILRWKKNPFVTRNPLAAYPCREPQIAKYASYEAITFMKYWLVQRLTWMDQNIPSLTGVNN